LIELSKSPLSIGEFINPSFQLGIDLFNSSITFVVCSWLAFFSNLLLISLIFKLELLILLVPKYLSNILRCSAILLFGLSIVSPSNFTVIYPVSIFELPRLGLGKVLLIILKVNVKPAATPPIIPVLGNKCIGCFTTRPAAILAPALKTAALPKLLKIKLNVSPEKIN